MKILDGVGDRTLRSMLEAWSSKAPTELMVMSPYVTEEAARFLAAVARKVVKSKGRVRILAGTKQSFTDPGALELLRELEEASDSIEVRTDFNLPYDGRFHSKLYIAELRTEKLHVLVGSTNLTNTGLDGAGELGVDLLLSLEDGNARRLAGYFDRWFGSGESVALTIKDYARRRTVVMRDVGRKPPHPLELVRSGAFEFVFRTADWSGSAIRQLKKTAAKLDDAAGQRCLFPALDRYNCWSVSEGQVRRGDAFLALFCPRRKKDWDVDILEVMFAPFPCDPKNPDRDDWVALTRPRPFPGHRRRRDSERAKMLVNAAGTLGQLISEQDDRRPTSAEMEALCRIVFPDLDNA